MRLVVVAFDYSPSFQADLAAAPLDVRRAANVALKLLKSNPQAGRLRLHSLAGYPKPTIYKIDVLANKSWQITFELNGGVSILRRIAPHRDIDRRPR